MMVSMLGGGLAAAEDGGQPQSDQAVHASKDASSTACTTEKQSPNAAQGDPDAPQNQVEYGGGA
jgi:hypothetical protein